MKIIGFNVNGLRAVLAKDKDGIRDTKNPNVLQSMIDEYEPDMICLQETKCPNDLNVVFKDYDYVKICDSKTKKGYSGVAIFSKIKPIKIHENFILNEEGRVICFEYPKFYLINTYVPNSKSDLSRLEYRINTWEPAIRTYINELQKIKPVIFTGDLNVAPTHLDIHNETGHLRAAGYTMEERQSYTKLIIDCKLIDTFRDLHPTVRKYSWFSNFGKARQNNKGWRIDMFLVSKTLKEFIKKADILTHYKGSDHVPILLEINE